MLDYELTVIGMSCQGCVSKLRRLIQEQEVEASITGEPKDNRLTVRSNLSLAVIETIIYDAGYKLPETKCKNELAQLNDLDLPEIKKTAEEVQTQRTNNAEPLGQTFQLSITGMTCASCVSSVQTALSNVTGVLSVEVNFATHTAQVRTTETADTVIDAIASIGYYASLILDEGKNVKERGQREKKEYRYKIQSSLLALGLGAPLMLYGLLGGNIAVSSLTERFVWLSIGLLTLWIMVRAGKHYFISAWKALKSQHANMDMLIALGTGSAWLYSVMLVLTPEWFPENTRHLYFEAAVMIIGLINLGQALELRARHKTSQTLHSLLDLRPEMAIRLQGGVESSIHVSDIKVSDILRVRSGDKIPVDGDVWEGVSTVNESMLTGESTPTKKEQGDAVSAGTVNIQGSLLFKATRIGSDTLLAQIINMVTKAQNSKPPISILADKVSSVFVPSVMIIAILTALSWFNLNDGVPLSYMLVTGVSVLIIACPCALGLATPISTMIGVGKAAEHGGLIRNGEALQRASELTVMVLDKTGTITEGKPVVVKQVLTNQIQQKEQHTWVAKIVHALESRTNHPLAQALLHHCENQLVSKEAFDPLALDDFESLIGLGVKGKFQGQDYYLGNERLMKEQGVSVLINSTDELDHPQATRVYLSNESTLLCVFFIEDPIKKNIKESISYFKQQGMKVIMLTGDNMASAKYVAKQAGVEDFQAELMPEDKLNRVKQLQQKGEIVGMVGDGINDAPALAQASVGFAMGAGADVAMESADVTLIHNDLKTVADVIQISRATLRNIKQNLWGAFIYNSLSIPIAAGLLFPLTGWLLSPIIAGAAMSLSSVSVVMNANRLRFFRVSHEKIKTNKEDYHAY